ncbi:MAG: putative LPS assembly protein LptD [Bacteroidia bacterium]
MNSCPANLSTLFVINLILFIVAPAQGKEGERILTPQLFTNATFPVQIYQSFPPDTIPPDTLDFGADSLGRDTTFQDSLDLSSSAFDSPVPYSADDSIRYDLKKRRVHFYGNAKVKYQKIELQAAHIYLTLDSATVYAEGVEDSMGVLTGNPVFIEGAREFKAKRMAYNFDTKKGKSYEIITQEGEGFLHAEEAKKDSNDVLYVRHAAYTTCDLEHPHYYISTGRAKVMPGKQIVTGPANLVVADVPLPLAIPFGFFPDQQKQTSGIIIPAYGETTRGFFFNNGGVFFSLNDYLNFALTGDIYTQGDYRLALSTKYAKRYKYRGNLDLEQAVLFEGVRETPTFSQNRSYRIQWTHVQDPKARPNSNFSGNVNFATSSDFDKELSINTNELLRSEVNSSISYSKDFANTPFHLTSSLNHSQHTFPDTVNDVRFTLPDVTLTMNRVTPFKRKTPVGGPKWYESLGFTYRLSYLNEIETKDTIFRDFSPAVFRDFRQGFQHSVPLSTSIKVMKYFRLNPSFSYNGFLYFDRERINYDPARDTLISSAEKGFYDLHSYNVNLSLTTLVYGFYEINKLGITQMRHVATPEVSLSYKPDFARSNYGYYANYINEAGESVTYSLYQSNVHSYPAQGEQGSLIFKLNNNFEMKVKSQTDTGETIKKIVLLRSLDINSSYNFLADSHQLAPFRLSANTNFLENYTVQSNATIHPYAIRDDSSGISKAYEWDKTGKLGRLTNFDISFNASLNPRNNDREDRRGLPDTDVSLYYYDYYDYYADFSVPWNLTFGYQFRYSKTLIEKNTTQTLNITGDVNITDKWKINVRGDYDFENKQVAYAEFKIIRDLHCWEMLFNWSPIGPYRNYYFVLRVKSTILSDLKLDKRRTQRDF